MDSANINNPTAVKALLDQLKASRVWQDALNANASHAEDHRSPGSTTNTLEGVQGESRTRSSATAPPASVASLLSQLRTSEWTSAAINTPPPPNARTTHQLSRDTPRPSQDLTPTRSEHPTPRSVVAASSTHVQDTRSTSFQQALPHLTRLASNLDFLSAISRLREEQTELEQQLWEERRAVHKKHEEKVQVARTKATLIGAGLSKHDTDAMNDAYCRDLQRFDKERVLLAWDSLIQRQQEALETLGVPTMFATTSQPDCQKQRRVIQVLEGL